MASTSGLGLMRRIDSAEERFCVMFNRWSEQPALRAFFVAISRLGDGIAWYVLILAVPVVFGAEQIIRSVQFIGTGLVGVVIYKYLKCNFVRERPYVASLSIRMGTLPLDRYSFPSGHTLHAIAFAVLFTTYFPVLAWLVIPFAGLVALSRLVLGLHYPTDVVAGGAIGAALAYLSIGLMA